MENDRRKQVQKEIEVYENTLTKEQIERAKKGFDNFLKWSKMVKLVPRLPEPNLVHDKLGFGGTPDLIGELIDGLSIIDWKTASKGKGKTVYDNQMIQISAYKRLWEFNYPKYPITGGFHLLKINKDTGGFAHFHEDNLDTEWEVFEHLLAIHKLKKKMKGE